MTPTTRNPIQHLGAIVEFAIFYIGEVVTSNLRVAYDVLTPEDYMRPGLLLISTQGLSSRQLFALANLITVTPGTVCVDVDDKECKMLIHCMYTTDPEADAQALEANFVRRIRNVF